MKRVQYADLVDKIIAARAPTTQGWDALCSYDITKVNEIFAREHNKNKIIPTDKKFQVSDYDRRTHTSYTVDYDLKIGNPTVQFLEGESGQCLVKFPIAEGSTSTVDNISTPIATGYSISMKVSLAHVSGSTVGASGDIVTLNQNDKATVVLHFDNSTDLKNSISSEPIALDPDTQDTLKDIVTVFQENVQDIDYDITTVTTDTASASGQGTKLTPKSFIFTTTTYDNGTDNNGHKDTGSALHVWIQTNESGVGVGINPPMFPIMIDATTRCFPIPQECTSSIIFNQDVIKNLYVTPSLKSISPFIEYTDSKNVDGIGVSIKLSNFTKKYSKSDSGWWGSYDFTCDDLNVNYDSNPIYINLDRVSAKIKWDWTQTISYSEYRYATGAPQGSTNTGKTKISASMDKIIEVNPLAISISVNKDDLSVTTEYIDDTSWWEGLIGIFGSDNTTLRDDVKTSVQNIPGISLDFGQINYFAEENIIFDGPAFKQKDVSICGDLLIIGDIA